jgi:hypothetical protein
MALLEPSLAGEELNESDREELAFHLGDILGDIEPLVDLFTKRVAPSPKVVRELINQVAYHWPYHQKKVARLANKMSNSGAGRGTVKRTTRAMASSGKRSVTQKKPVR